jgi:hypothetical protein
MARSEADHWDMGLEIFLHLLAAGADLNVTFPTPTSDSERTPLFELVYLDVDDRIRGVFEKLFCKRCKTAHPRLSTSRSLEGRLLFISRSPLKSGH